MNLPTIANVAIIITFALLVVMFKREQALVIDEKRRRVANYVINLRSGLFMLAAAAGIDSPTKFSREHVVFKDENGVSKSLLDIAPYPK